MPRGKLGAARSLTIADTTERIGTTLRVVPIHMVMPPVRASDLLGHCGGVVTCDQPLLAVPLVGVCGASLDLRPSRAKRECVQPGVDRGRATNLY